MHYNLSLSLVSSGFILLLTCFILPLTSCGKLSNSEDQSNPANPDPAKEPKVETPNADEANEPGSTPSPSGEILKDQSLIPLKVGNEWTWKLSGDGSVSWCSIPDDGIRKSKVTSSEKVDEVEIYKVEGAICSAGMVILESHDGDSYFSHTSGQKYQFLTTPKDNAAFNIGSNQYLWTKLDAVTTDAGVFTDCWRLALEKSVSITYTDYCRGVGAVKYFLDDQHGNTVTAVLKEKNF